MNRRCSRKNGTTSGAAFRGGGLVNHALLRLCNDALDIRAFRRLEQLHSTRRARSGLETEDTNVTSRNSSLSLAHFNLNGIIGNRHTCVGNVVRDGEGNRRTSTAGDKSTKIAAKRSERTSLIIL